MSDPKKKQQFLNLPQYPGGKKAFNEFISASIIYPEEALKAGVEGTVIVEFEIDNNGAVQPLRVLKSLGYGCDEEALRVVGLLRYAKAKNRGVRLKTTTKTTIRFKIPAQAVISYSVTPSPAKKPAEPQPEKSNMYNYTIQF